MASRRNQKDQKKAERLAREAAARERQKRRTRFQIMGGGLVLLVVVGFALVIVSQSGKDKGTGLKGVNQVNRSLLGVEQKGESLGSAKAPITVVEFADLQCPFCRDFSNQVLPKIIDRYVKTGKVQMQLKLVSFIGPDSERAARNALFAGQQGRMWNFAEIFYKNQGAEGSGYVTSEFLSNVSRSAGVTPLPTAKDLQAKSISAQMDEAMRQGEKNKVTATPSFLIGKTGGKLELWESRDYGFEAFKAYLDYLLKQS